LYYITEGLYSADRRRKQAARAQETEEQKVANSRRMRAARAQETEEQKVADKKRKQAARAQEAAGQAWPDVVHGLQELVRRDGPEDSCGRCASASASADRRLATDPAAGSRTAGGCVEEHSRDEMAAPPTTLQSSWSTAAMRWRRP
jgi:hypothetical protein